MSTSRSASESGAGSIRPNPPLSERHRQSLAHFVDFWGEMASRWGINRTMAQIHAYLYASEAPVDTDTIMAQLGISRGNANMNLHSLLRWNLVRKVQLAGSRKDYFAAEKDVWEITAQIVRERKKREVRPVRDELQACRVQLRSGSSELDASEAQFQERLDSLIELMEVFEGFTETVMPLIEQRNVPLIRQLIALARGPEPDDHGTSEDR